MKIKIGTRGSKLAMWQAHYVEQRLQQAGADTEIIPIETKGDKILDVTIAKIGSKGVFTEEIEEQLASGAIDIAVHSAKDMQSELPEGFELIAFGEREPVNDVLIAPGAGINLDDPQLVIGTSSTRRIAFLKRHYPHISTVPVRGNLQTRIRKMEEGVCDALFLAYAGVNRMGYNDMIAATMDVDRFTPAVGQGSIAIEVEASLDDSKKHFVRKCINHEVSEKAVLAERAYLKTMQGGCSVPIFGYAEVSSGKINLRGGIISLDGSEMVVHTTTSGYDTPEEAGQALGKYVLDHGGGAILAEIRRQQSMK